MGRGGEVSSCSLYFLSYSAFFLCKATLSTSKKPTFKYPYQGPMEGKQVVVACFNAILLSSFFMATLLTSKNNNILFVISPI